VPLSRHERHQRIIAAGSLDALLNEPDGLAILQAEADDNDNNEQLITHPQLSLLLTLRVAKQQTRTRLGAFFSNKDAFIVPGFMGSTLRDVRGPNGLIWIDPRLALDSSQLSSLKLAPYAVPKRPDREADSGVDIEANSTLPAIYDLLILALELDRYDAQIHPFDWRKDLERSAMLLADRIRNRQGKPARPLHIIAHSQGALVARRAIQMLGSEKAHQLVNSLVLLGPANYGTFSAAFALAGTHETIAEVERWGVTFPPDLGDVLQSFTGLYQLLPGDNDRLKTAFKTEQFKESSFWKRNIDATRLREEFGWGKQIDTSFFNDRTTIILGNAPAVGAVAFTGDELREIGPRLPGDGTVPDNLARLDGVQTYRAEGVPHMTIAMSNSVIRAVLAILRGQFPSIESVPFASRQKDDVLTLRKPKDPESPKKSSRATVKAHAETPSAKHHLTPRPMPPAPPCRQLRVFSFDPLLATHLDALDIAELTLEIPWEPDGKLLPGPVGEYLEVVDYDPASNAFYHPVDLSHPRLAAQDGLPPSESDPQFHQQMVYAVAMSTIATFEQALGRRAMWAPRFQRDEQGKVIDHLPEEEYVARLRIYPHALREANAYYDPDRHSLLFGYFPSSEQPGGKTLPGGTVFTCQSFDIIAHETTHALLHGLHRYFLHPSNPDVFAFHEAFADAVALFQHFSHIDVVRHQIAKSRGDLRQGKLLGQLAQQFGQAMGTHRGALREYVNVDPDPAKYGKTEEPHDRGAILMAALFRAFLNIYEHRTRDLYRIATNGTGKLPDGDIHPDLVNRLAVEASRSARHLLTMCVRALDYVPPTDLTFGEYLRALITADYDLVRDDDRGYRVSVIDAFRSWGIYPSEVNVLDESALRWRAPTGQIAGMLREPIHKLKFTDWTLRTDRRAAYLRMAMNGAEAHEWVKERADVLNDLLSELGLALGNDAPQGIMRDKDGVPRFEFHSVRPCARVGPDGQQRIDLVAEVVQKRKGFFDEAVQAKIDAGKASKADTNRKADFEMRGGCTLIIDPESGDIRYSVIKSILDDERLARQREYEQHGFAAHLAASTYFGSSGRNPFALLHTDE